MLREGEIMATRKINEDVLIKKALKEINKDLGVSDKSRAARIKSFSESIKAAPPSFLNRIKDVWKAFAALMAGFFTIGFIIARLTIPTETTMLTASVSPDSIDSYHIYGSGPFGLAELTASQQTVATVEFVSPDQYEFKAFDNDGDGQLNLAEAQAAKEALAINQFEFSDIDSNGKLNFEESTKAVYAMSQNQFTSLDMNNDKQLSFEEVDQDIGNMSDIEFNKLDRDQNGKLDYAEAQYMFVIIFVES